MIKMVLVELLLSIIFFLMLCWKCGGLNLFVYFVLLFNLWFDVFWYVEDLDCDNYFVIVVFWL